MLSPPRATRELTGDRRALTAPRHASADKCLEGEAPVIQYRGSYAMGGNSMAASVWMVAIVGDEEGLMVAVRRAERGLEVDKFNP